YADPDRLVMVWEENSSLGFPRNTPAPANWLDWTRQNTVFTGIAATRGGTASLTGDGPPEQLLGRRTTANFWTVLGAAPLLGRVFTEAEEKANAPVTVISFGLWQRRFGGDPNMPGRKILLDGQPFTVIGVMPRGFAFPTRLMDLWRPAG